MGRSLLFVLGVVALFVCVAHGQLGQYYVDPDLVHVSGLSAGSYMAVQMAVAFSETFSGVGAIAGGPFYCAEGDLVTALTACMTTPNTINVGRLISETEDFERQGQIDSLSNLQNQKVYIFAGKSDNTVDPKTSDKTQEFYLNFMNQSNILYESSMDTGHAHITDNYGNGCKTSSSPYINNCGYDQSGALLAHLHRNALKPKVSMVAANLQKFDQTEYPAESMQKEGFVYVPTGCQNGDLCGLHVALHGCVQNSDNFQVGEKYVTYAGYNEWAEANNIIILYPQATSSLSNQNSCFDWWGYSGQDYPLKSGSQMAAIKKMIDQLMSGAPQLLKPEGLHASNISDHDIVLAWEQVPDATGYQISRNGNNLTPEPIPDQTFHEAGLSSGTTYEYSVIARAGSSSSPPSTIQVTTTGNPPPLAAPELSTSDLTATSIKLSWTSLSGASGYQVFRNGANFINVTENTYTDTGLTEQTTYTYTVLGHTAEGLLGPHSNVVTITTPPSWQCKTYFDHNYGHVAEGHAYQNRGEVYAQGSNEYMGLYNVAVFNTLAEVSNGYYIIGDCE